jgi:hypothetical protein
MAVRPAKPILWAIYLAEWTLFCLLGLGASYVLPAWAGFWGVLMPAAATLLALGIIVLVAGATWLILRFHTK